MDTTDPEITFDENGVCNHCKYFDEFVKPNWFPNDEGLKKLEKIIDKIKKEAKSYDCIIGLSGGVDSAYMSLKMHELFSINPLVVHVDAGWDYEVAVQNIERLVKYCNWDLHTHVMNWEDMRELQLAYFRSGISNQDVPQDHAFFASLYDFAIKNKIKYVLSGGNFATEAIFPSSWHYTAMDGKNLINILEKFGNGYKLNDFKVMNFFEYYFYYPYVKKMRVIRPLNYMPYSRNKAIQEMEKKFGFKSYGNKHCESVFTRFFQNYFLIKRFGFDKRKPHFSTLILAGEMTREEALKELAKPLYDPAILEEDKLYIAKKLGISKEELESLLTIPKRDARNFNNQEKILKLVKFFQSFLERILNRRIANYS